jgi:hypothetical protein
MFIENAEIKSVSIVHETKIDGFCVVNYDKMADRSKVHGWKSSAPGLRLFFEFT